jgi:hypothetical protein
MERKATEASSQLKKNTNSSSSFLFQSSQFSAATIGNPLKERPDGSSKHSVGSQAHLQSPKTKELVQMNGGYSSQGISFGGILQNDSGLTINTNGAFQNKSNGSLGAQYYQAFQRKYMGTGAGDCSPGVNLTQLALSKYKNSRKEENTEKKNEFVGRLSKNLI